MPDFPIVDSHLHLWNPRTFRMAWLDGNDVLNQRYELAEFRQHSEDLPIQAMVYLQTEVETPYAFLEARWAVELAQEDARLRGVVPWAPLEFGERAKTFLEALRELGPLVKGVRRIIQFEDDLGFCLRPDFVRGVQILAEYDLSFDVCIDHRHLPNAIKLIAQCPNTSFILDHIGKPDIKSRVLDPWREQISQLAAFSNVSCKISGLVTEANHQGWTLEDLRPYVQHVIAAFGEDRIAFGGDWPVVLQASQYRRWIETLDRLTEHLSAAARQNLWAENATRFYRLEG